MNTLADKLAEAASFNQMVVPDLWQQQAVSALRAGKDVVVQAPTGSGKTLIFELWSNLGKPHGTAIYTVPTRALANDKLAEWRARGWDVGIATGDLSENLEAPIIVATLETQKQRLIRGEGPSLLVVDEYQMIADTERGLNYELALAMAPLRTRLLLLSGSVANPQDVVKWLRRLGREAVLIKHDERPVPLEEIHAHQLSYHVPSEISTYWARLAAKALAEDCGPLLIFAPRRRNAEDMAADLARQLPTPHPLSLSPAQKAAVGDHLAKLLKCRIAYHHSGLSYAARAGVIEPLAKAGQLRVVVATMGLAAGINFSLRSVALAADSYRRDQIEQPLRSDEILQMFGRAGRRGIDEVGYVIVSANNLRLLDAHAAHLSRSAMVDWSALLGVMHIAAEDGRNPFAEAVRVQERLFTTKSIFLGVEHAMKHPDAPCGLRTDSERARHVRKLVRQFLNSRGEWEDFGHTREVPLGQIKVGRILLSSDFRVARAGHASSALTPALSPEEREKRFQRGRGVNAHEIPQSHGELSPLTEGEGQGEGKGTSSTEQVSELTSGQAAGLRPVLTEPAALQKIGTGLLVVVDERDGEKCYGRAVTVADVLHDGRIIIAKWVRRLTGWGGRDTTRETWLAKVVPPLEKRMEKQHLPILRFVEENRRIVAHVSLARQTMRVPVDRHGVALWKPFEQEVLPPDCAQCTLVDTCRQLATSTGTALLWRRLRLVDEYGTPSLFGRVVSCYQQGDGLAVAAALEDNTYPIEELVYDLANLEGGFRFAGDENRWGGKLSWACQKRFGTLSIPGYLENGVPPGYGAGAEQVVAAIHKEPAAKQRWENEFLGPGDIDRVIIEWRSLLRQTAHAPDLDWPRWQELQRLAKEILHETESPTETELPPLEFHQTRRVDHRLILRRH